MTVETRGERMLELRKARMAASPPILRGAFRPFFVLGALWAVIYLRRRSSIAPVVSHAGFNSLEVIRIAVTGA